MKNFKNIIEGMLQYMGAGIIVAGVVVLIDKIKSIKNQITK